MTWTALVPVKGSAQAKSRLAGVLSEEERQTLSRRMAAHVLSVLIESPAISRVVCLSPTAPVHAGVAWSEDRGRGLNAELTAFRADDPAASLLIIHADLPFLQTEDIAALTAAAEAQGAAIAPDRLGSGTNALALMPAAAAQFAFGIDSFAAHQALVTPAPSAVARQGLTHDVDTPQDLELALRLGAEQVSWVKARCGLGHSKP